MGVTDCDEVGVFLRKLAAGDAVICLDEFLWERWVFQRPEAKVAALQLVIGFYANIVLAIARGYQVRVCSVYIDASDLAALGKVTFECKEVFQNHFSLLELFFNLLFFFLLFLFLVFLVAQETKTFLAFFFVVVLAVC